MGRDAREALNMLQPNQRAAVLLHRYTRMTCREISVTLGCDEQAVVSLLLTAYETLRNRLLRPAPASREL